MSQIKALPILLTIAVAVLSIAGQKAELVVQAGHSAAVTAVAFSPDGKTLASASWDSTIKLWDVASGKELRTIAGQGKSVNSVSFSPDGRTLASAADDGAIKIWDVESGTEIATLPAEIVPGSSVALSPDGKMIASAGANQTIKLWDIASHKEVRTLVGHSLNARTFSFSPDGKTLASGSWDKTIKLWDVASGKDLGTLVGHTGFVNSVEFSPDGKTLISGSDDKTVMLWDVATRTLKETFAGHTGGVKAVGFSPDGKTLASGSADGTAKLWNVASGKALGTFTGFSSLVDAIRFSPDGKALATGDWNGKIKLWDAVTGAYFRTLTGDADEVQSISLSPDGKVLASACLDHGIKLWDLGGGKEVRDVGDNASLTMSVSFAPDGKTLAGARLDGKIVLWDVETANALRVFVGHTGWINTVIFSPDGQMLASASDDKTVKLWDVATGKELRTLSGHSDNVRSVAFSPDGKILASASNDNTVKLWDVAAGTELKTLTGHTSFVTAVRFAPDGKTLATASWDNTVKLWDAASGKELKTLTGHSVYVQSLAFSHDGLTLATADVSGGIILWEVARGTELRTLTGHSGVVGSLAFSPDGKTLISGSVDETVNVWNVKTGERLATLIGLGRDDWVVTTRAGLFDASPGARRKMHYVIGLESFDLEQMKDAYYVPGLLQKVFKGEPLPKVELFSRKDLFPEVAFDAPKEGQKDLKINLTNRGGGIGAVQVLINGKEFIADARPPGFDTQTKQPVTLTVDLAGAPFVPNGENKIEVVARNAEGSLTNRGTAGSVVARGANPLTSHVEEKKETPNIYAIVGGISNYTGSQLKLNFAAKDASDFARALEIGATKLVGDPKKVHIRLLTSDGADPQVKLTSTDAKATMATKADFQRAFADFKGATSNDVFIVYLAGHGVALNLNGDNQVNGTTYLYLTQEATSFDPAQLRLENTRSAMTLSGEELKDLMKENKALKQVLILDTCAAGKAADSFVAKRDIPSDQVAALERLKDNTGFYILMGSASDAVSYESGEYGQGLLTRALLQGMQGEKLRDGEFADVEPLFGYAKDTVQQLAKNIGGIQSPETITPYSSKSFDIGRFTETERSQIHLPSKRPRILRPKLQNDKLHFDNLKLEPIFAAALRDQGYIAARGASAPIVYIDADDVPDAILPSGVYVVNGDTISLSVVLVKNNEPLGDEITVSGPLADKDSLIRQLVDQIVKRSAS